MEMKELIEAVKTSSAEIKASQAKLDAEVKTQGEATAETKAALEKANGEMARLIKSFEDLDAKLIKLETEAKRVRDAQGVERKSLGRAFIESEVYDHIKSSQRGNGQPASFDRKDISSLAASAGALIRPDRDPEVYRDPYRAVRIRDLIPSISTASGSVEVMRLNVFTNNAGPQEQSPSSGVVGGGEFGVKNQSNITWELVTYPVRTIAHWVPASRQALSDSGMLQGLIDTELTYGLQLESDAQLLLGDGTGQNVTGLLVDSDVQDIGDIAAGTSDANLPAAMIDHIRAGVTALQLAEYYNANGIVLNPQDWETLETAKATDGHYLMIQYPANGADQRIWRMPVIITNAMPQGTFLMGDWTMGAKLYERENVTVRVSESHADYFVRNGVAILAEERYAFAIPRPNAFVKGSFDVAAS